MTIKEERAAELDKLKEIGNGSVVYMVERLDSCFRPIETFRCCTIEAAEMVYEKLLEHNRPAFVNKYAVVPMK